MLNERAAQFLYRSLLQCDKTVEDKSLNGLKKPRRFGIKQNMYTLLVLIFADFAVFNKVRENLFPRKMVFWKILSF